MATRDSLLLGLSLVTFFVGGTALAWTGAPLAKGGHFDWGELATIWVVVGALLAILNVLDRRMPLMLVCVGCGFTAIIVGLVASEAGTRLGFQLFGVAAFALCVGATIRLVRILREINAQPNPLRDAARERFEDPPLYEKDGVQYLVSFGTQDAPSALHVRVFLQNCYDVRADATVRLEEDDAGQPSVRLPKPATVELPAGSCSVLEWVCPTRPSDEPRGFFHVSLGAKRQVSGKRVLMWQAAAGAGRLKSTQLIAALGSRQYVARLVELPPATANLALAREDIQPLSEDELRAELQRLAR